MEVGYLTNKSPSLWNTTLEHSIKFSFSKCQSSSFSSFQKLKFVCATNPAHVAWDSFSELHPERLFSEIKMQLLSETVGELWWTSAIKFYTLLRLTAVSVICDYFHMSCHILCIEYALSQKINKFATGRRMVWFVALAVICCSNTLKYLYHEASRRRRKGFQQSSSTVCTLIPSFSSS